MGLNILEEFDSLPNFLARVFPVAVQKGAGKVGGGQLQFQPAADQHERLLRQEGDSNQNAAVGVFYRRRLVF